MKIIKKNTWENLKIDVEIKIKNQFPNTLLKLIAKTLKKIRIFALKIVNQNNPKEWVFIAIPKN